MKTSIDYAFPLVIFIHSSVRTSCLHLFCFNLGRLYHANQPEFRILDSSVLVPKADSRTDIGPIIQKTYLDRSKTNVPTIGSALASVESIYFLDSFLQIS
jgi:hypothetical protein